MTAPIWGRKQGNMSAHIEWLSSRYTDVTAEAQPGGFENAGDSNAAACLIITSQNDGHGIVIEGRPDNLLEKAREILRAAELLVEKTMRDPELRSLYGIRRDLREVSDQEYADLQNGRTTLDDLGVRGA